MRYILRIKRRPSGDAPSYWQDVEYHCEDGDSETVATALDALNKRSGAVDTKGRPIGEIGWECSCLQKKCGACAMVIGGRPGLACDAYLSRFKAGRPIVVEPLRKFPVVRDLIVDRSAMRENLKSMGVWLEQAAALVGERDRERIYDASRCLQCGCCLEVCPNFCLGDTFCGAAGAVPAARLLYAGAEEDRQRLKKAYDRHIYAGCGKSLSCADVCPVKLELEGTLAGANALAIWRR